MHSDLETLTRTVIDAAFHIHDDLGPGLFESVYETLLEAKLEALGLRVRRQILIDIEYQGIRVANAFKIDLLVEDQLLLELKSVEQLAPVHAKQVITYLRLARLPLGLLINFGAATFKEGVKRLANTRAPLAA